MKPVSALRVGDIVDVAMTVTATVSHVKKFPDGGYVVRYDRLISCVESFLVPSRNGSQHAEDAQDEPRGG
jgi:hypothetical protein